MVQVEVYTVKNKKLGDISITRSTKVNEIKEEIAKISKLSVDRQSVRSDIKGKDIKNEDSIPDIETTRKIFVKDLGPQIGWNTVFLLEYAGPLVLYAVVACRPWILYGELAYNPTFTTTAKIALACWSIHYLKRVLETLFVHRFSHGTMPIRNLFKNCGYYWGFCIYVAYHVNHPLFTPPPIILQAIGLGLFALCEGGNLATHVLLRNLRPAGSTVRKIPKPDSCPLNLLFNYVSCPNYTYEVGSWIGFTILTSCLPAAIFTFAGFYQMAVWALGKHRNYKKEFSDYPKQRKAIIPFIL
ncbi:probable very-long-chain enoyl-CoA reductase art-1 [Diorhabda sublineata]|uniref:probable very-long-chain enoyl-CoA reductase art-1 n=1 Tax=Diorhabda sublineata TaxID=1163346 RepID=UPI0024E154E2|nr:probable very-long-chain enoyl-CoA reductase art-1 [Diorhabda sublineata]XP_056645321.1 probable very-long-chain enoyl-CoA reductase art-1 [Diorhabda sublineata]XP_056645322.1 probable very-long-chain enoyl-CoA reductase art-1 [Diorhabda sublineata]XP_056645323.1 probable very-long-chain enoyl-CoA reductase art-1 [Diorhabda sublineata]